MTDPELIARAVCDEDTAAFGELVRRHQSAVRLFLRHLTRGDSALADDLAQDSFVQAWRRLSTFRGGSAFPTWVMGIAHNLWRNARRRQRTTPLEREHLEGDESAPSPAPASDLRQDLAAAFRQLEPAEQTALHLCYYHGRSHSEIAEILGWPLGTVKTHINRGKEKLRPLLTPWNVQT